MQTGVEEDEEEEEETTQSADNCLPQRGVTLAGDDLMGATLATVTAVNDMCRLFVAVVVVVVVERLRNVVQAHADTHVAC